MSVQTTTFKISIIIPARNSEQVLPECLEGLKASTYTIEEIIVVNDGSTDNTLSVAEKYGVKTVHLDSHHDANYCRNKGAEVATGDILLFLDSDVVVQPESIQRVLEAFSDKSIDGIVGLYSARHRYKNLASQYKNLWIRYSYLKSDPKIDWIFGAIAAIRKDVFWQVGGFDAKLAAKHGIDDLELGKRMTKSECGILLNTEVEVEHLKRHTFVSLLKNDFARSQWFVQLAGGLKQITGSFHRGFVNVYPTFIFSTVISWPILITGMLGFWVTPLWWAFLFLSAIYLGLNIPFLSFFAEQRGLIEMIRAIGVMFVDHLVCTLGTATGFIKWLMFHLLSQGQGR